MHAASDITRLRSELWAGFTHMLAEQQWSLLSTIQYLLKDYDEPYKLNKHIEQIKTPFPSKGFCGKAIARTHASITLLRFGLVRYGVAPDLEAARASPAVGSDSGSSRGRQAGRAESGGGAGWHKVAAVPRAREKSTHAAAAAAYTYLHAGGASR